MIDSYTFRIDQFTEEYGRLLRLKTIYSIIRLLLFAGSVTLLISLLSINQLVAFLSSFLALAGLIAFISLSNKISRRLIVLEELIRINRDEISCLNGEFKQFRPGNIYEDADHYFTSDLDIFGENSLYQFLNRTGLSSGGDKLAGYFIEGTPSAKIIPRQEAFSELSNKIHWRQMFQVNGNLAGDSKKDIQSLQGWLNSSPFLLNKPVFRILLLILPLLTLLCLILSLSIIPVNIPVFFVLLQLGFVGIKLRQSNNSHSQLTRKFNLIVKYSELLKSLEKEKFNSSLLNEVKSDLNTGNISSGHALKQLAGLVERFDWRINMVTGILLNGLLMWDLQCVLRLERWKKKHSDKVPYWFNVMAEFDALNSIANYHYSHPSAIFPQIQENGPVLHARGLAHPLIPLFERVGNDIDINSFGEYHLITGSNMAGKSTFLRTVGVNLALASIGAPVCAESMIFRPVTIVSSMRIKDSLSSRESTFYAELKRLRLIIDLHEDKDDVFVILDEILKGTNSRDKHFGSEMLIRQLIKFGSSGIIATHDLDLSRLEDEFPENLMNYCFEVEIDNQEFYFDYKLRRGVCKTMNATALMKKMGIQI
jgi:hypothetical protein